MSVAGRVWASIAADIGIENGSKEESVGDEWGAEFLKNTKILKTTPHPFLTDPELTRGQHY